MLDEATSHLDVMNERAVNEAIKGMRLTRIIVAHRPETIAMASRVVILEQGKIVRDLEVPGQTVGTGLTVAGLGTPISIAGAALAVEGAALIALSV